METVVLFADISGFTNISEACAKMGVRGNEELAFCINRYMEGMVKSLGKYGGDIIKFVGDAMIVMWPRSVPGGSGGGGGATDKNLPTQGSQSGDDRTTVVRKAIQCAIDIQNELNNKQIMSNVTNLSVKIGIGFGDCALLYVGGVFNRAEFFTVGDALTQALNSEENATAGGQIIVSQNAWAQVVDFFESQEIINEHGKKFYRILGLIQGIRARAEAVLLRNQVQTENTRIQSKLRACVPAAIMPYLEIGYEQYGSETRRLTVMFASLGIDLSSAKTKEGMMKIQKIVTTVQQQVYRMEGSLNKLVMDDKGSTLICIWGLCPFSHEDDAARAILTAMNIRRELLKIENTWCNMGISTGEVFSGVVGTSGSRKEFSVLGDYVNLAARIMYYPKKYKQTGKIYVDFQTKKEADNYINFLYKDHCEFKGKSISLPIYEPLDPADEALQCIKKIAPIDTFLKIHSNPFLIDKNSEHKKKQVKQIGRDNLLSNVTDELLDFFDEDNQENSKPYILAVYGEIGSGKTLFARCIADFMRKRKDVFRDSHLGADQKPILMSALNPESQMKFMNIWRPILQMMLYMLSKRAKMPVEDVLTMHIKNVKDERYAILLDIFGMTQMNNEGEIINLPLPNDPLQFVKRERYSEEVVDGCLDCIIEFIKLVLGENFDEDDLSDDFQSQVDRYQRQRHPNPLANLGGSPCLVILDAVHLMDEPSWRLLELIKDECSKIAIILMVQTDTNNQPKIHPEARSFFNETFGHHSDCIKVIDLPPFKLEDISALISELAPKYQVHMGEDIHLQTYIADPQHSIKNPEVCKQKQKDLRKQYMLQEQFFTKINEEVLTLVLQRCEGNPLISLNFLFNLLAGDYLVQKGNTLDPTAKFMKCKLRQDWTIVPCAGISLKINSTLLDNFIKEMRAKPHKADQETSIKGLLLLKCAAVVGDQFGSMVLQHISPLRHETHQQIIHILKILEARDLIEILDESDPKNAICRFTKSFLRETIYQVMLYRAQKKGIHQLVVEHIQDNPLSIDQDPEIEAEKLLWHILLAEDLDSEDKIPSKSKQGLIVKKIANQLLKNPNAVVKRGMLTKQGDKPNKKVEERFMILRSKHLAWFHDQKEFEQGKKPLGVIPTHAIYHCMPAKTEKPTDDLNIGTCAWSKKDVEKEGRREFIFGAENQNQRDEWISCIEYLRTKAIYDSFVSKYCNISFPLRRQSDEVMGDQKQDMMKQLTDFGYKFRTQAILNKSPATDDQYQSGPTHARHQRGSSMKRSGPQKHNSSFFVSSAPVIDANKAQDLAQKIKKLFNISIVSYVSHVSQNANKTNRHRHDSLRRLPESLRNSTMISQLTQEEQPENPPMGSSRLPSFLVNNQSTLLEDSPMGRLDKFKDMRRMSEIARKQQPGEDSQVVRFIEDLRSADTSPPERKQDSNSSDNIIRKGFKPNLLVPRKSIISNFTAKSQPQPISGQSHLHTSNSDMSAPVPHDETQDIEQDNPRQKSRISVQIAMVNQGQRTQRNLTFQNLEQIEAQQQQQIFSVSKVSQKPRATTALGMEQIEEREEFDPLRRGSGGDTTQQNDRKYEVTSQTSKSEERKTTEDNDTRRTGKFSHIESPIEKRHKTTANKPQDLQMRMNKQKEVKPDEARIESPEIVNMQQPPGVIQAQTQGPNLTDLISQTIKEQVSKGIQEILQSVTSFTQQHLQAATASAYASQTSIRGFNQDPYSPSQRGYAYPSPSQDRMLNLSYASVHGGQRGHHGFNNVGGLSSHRSSASQYQEPPQYQSMAHRLRLRQQQTSNGSGQGGASSSKKLKMEQPRSKGGAGVNSSMMVSRGMIVQEDDCEDVVESPEGSSERELPEMIMPLRESSDGLRKKNPPKKDLDERRNTVFNQKAMNPEQTQPRIQHAYQDAGQRVAQARSPPPTLNLNNVATKSEPRSSSLVDQRSVFQQSVQGGAMPSSSLHDTSRFDSHSPPSSAYYQVPMQPTQQRSQQYILPPQLYPQTSYNSQQQQAAFKPPRYNPDPYLQHPSSYDSLPPPVAALRPQHFFSSPGLGLAPFHNTPGAADYSMIYPAQDQSYLYHSDPPSLDLIMPPSNARGKLQREPAGKLHTWAIVMEDAISVYRSAAGGSEGNTGQELTQLYEGDKVEVIRVMPDQESAECRLEGLVGVFPLACLKIVNNQRQDAQLPSPEKNRMVQEQKSKLKLNERKKQRQSQK